MMKFQLLLLVCYCFTVPAYASIDSYSKQEIALYALKESHPAKKVLDNIVQASSTSVFYDMHSMTKSGFDFAIPQHKTKIIVTRHPKLPGLVIKAYLDTQEYYDGKPEHYYWIKRVQGANLIRESIKKHHYEHLLKVPRKWIYELPQKPHLPLPANCLPKKYILVEDDMNIVDDKTNKARWKSPDATRELLAALHTVITESKFKDCAKPANCPFCVDGKVALVDTQSFYKKKVGYYKLTPYLTKEMQEYWRSLSPVGVKGY